MASEKATLIITEKPQAAAKIAAALSNETDEKLTSKEGVAYYEFYRGTKRYIVGCAVGHLYGVQQKALRGPFPNFEIEWKASHLRKGGSYTKKYLDTLKRLTKETNEYIVATDFDVEGEVIGWNVIRFICKQKDAQRMKYSLLTKEALQKSFENLEPNLNWGAAIAGETRHYLDWYYGINLSRGLMKALSTTGTFRILSIGRVQGPALSIVVKREREITNFKPQPYWQVFLQIRDIKGNKLEVKYPKDIYDKSELLKFKHLKGKKGQATTKITEEDIHPPVPFDLTTLQTESYKHYGYTPTQTLAIAQNLYLAGMISYPRTASQQYPASIGYDTIMKRLKKQTTLTKHATKKKPIQGKKTDPAHPAIYPTGEQNKKMNEREKKVYDLIIKRFIACFCEDAKVEYKKVTVEVNTLKFNAKGTTILKKGWTNVYPHNIKETDIPTINGTVDVTEIRTEEKETKPPKRYTAASLVKELEKRGLGTKATRATIVETLYSRGYVKEKSIIVTELGLSMAKTLETHSPIILDEEMTKKMSEELETMEIAKTGWNKKEQEILTEAQKTVTTIAEDMKKNLEAIGKGLGIAHEQVITEEREQATMNTCPKCNKGNLRVMYGKKYSRYFISCDAYPTCKNIYSLPPKGMMKPARLNKKTAVEQGKAEGELELCEECNYPKIISLQKGRSPWKFCFNPQCPTNEETQKKKEAFKEKLAKGEITIDKEGNITDHTKKAKKKTVKKKKTTRKKTTKKKKTVKKAKKKVEKTNS